MFSFLKRLWRSLFKSYSVSSVTENTKGDTETSSGPKKPMTKTEEFISCLAISRKYGINDWCIVTHAWHESGAFKKVIGKYNFWGIKKPEKWTGLILPISTHEYIRGKRKSLVDYFIDFDTCEQALSWYCDLIQRLYKNAFDNRNVPEEYFRGLTNGRFKYATDPKYAEKLISLYRYLKTENEELVTSLKSGNTPSLP